MKAFEIQYQYQKLDGLYKYMVFDVLTKVGKKDENKNKRLLLFIEMIKFFQELIEKE